MKSHVSYLRRIDIDILDSKGRTSLHYVNDLQTAAILLEARANVKAVDVEGNTALHTLCLGYSATGDDQVILGKEGQRPSQQ